jgi:hypothetical protein
MYYDDNLDMRSHKFKENREESLIEIPYVF